MTLLFDLDGTLIDSNHIWQQIDVEFLARRGIPWTETYNQGVIHATFPTAACFAGNSADYPRPRMRSWQSGCLWPIGLFPDIPLKNPASPPF